MVLSELEQLYKNDPVAFTLWLTEAKNMATKEGDIARALIENNIARKLVENSTISTNKSRGSSTNSSRTNDRICICSPTTHAGSFKCKYHRSMANISAKCSSNPPNNEKPQPQDRDGETFNGLKTVRTVSVNGQTKLSRFGRAANCEDLSLKVK